MSRAAPQVLCLSGHDPSGGAGIQADIEVCAALGVHAISIITAHTVQDSESVQRVCPVAPILLAQQLDALIADCAPLAVKLGLLGEPSQVSVIAERIAKLRRPVVLDPVLRAGGGQELAGAPLRAAMIEGLFPQVDLLTPNAAEARSLAGQPTLQACGEALLKLGPRRVLITGGDEPGEEAVNWLYSYDAAPARYAWPRLPETFHGAGCTLATAIAALLAQGRSWPQAVEQAQRYVHESLRRALAIGHGRRIPGRLPR